MPRCRYTFPTTLNFERDTSDMILRGKQTALALYETFTLYWSYLYHIICRRVRNRAAQIFWGLMLQTPNLRLAQILKVYQVSGSSGDVWPRPQSSEGVPPQASKPANVPASELWGRGQTPPEGPETWYTFRIWANLKFGVWSMRPRKIWAALNCTGG